MVEHPSSPKKSIDDVERTVLIAVEMMERQLGRQLRVLSTQVADLSRELSRTHTELKHLMGENCTTTTVTVDAKPAAMRLESKAEVMELNEIVEKDKTKEEAQKKPEPAACGLLQSTKKERKSEDKKRNFVETDANAEVIEAKKKRTFLDDDDRTFLDDDLTQDEQLLVTTGRGRMGEVQSTPLGFAYWTKGDRETLLSIGTKIGVEPLTMYSMNRYKLKLKQFRVQDEFVSGTRLWIVPHEDWEHQYIQEDRCKVLQDLYDRINDVWPDFLKNTKPLADIKRSQLAKYESSKRFYDMVQATMNRAETQARTACAAEHLHDLKIVRLEFEKKWRRDGFLPPSEIIERH
ncbi:unnamed product [Ostreococcus tauri]|uniref:Unnamed product n=1 Tax=Ostreococcus tauri TaxID=70448 RepID=Q01GE1_OSTTA|nr:unnamed product [Ostreococcus tauri]CAL50203.1 unnamed product [Ostreococcus tauri]|eukprot:XP_003074352.1 unnamed product [Ostreococcus tauri]